MDEAKRLAISRAQTKPGNGSLCKVLAVHTGGPEFSRQDLHKSYIQKQAFVI